MNKKSLLSKVGSAIRLWWILSLSLSIAYSSLKDLSWIKSYQSINWGLLALQFIGLIILGISALKLYELNPKIMGFSWWRLISKGKDLETGGNINLLGWDIKYFGILICILLLTALPSWAAFEEELFRRGTLDWPDALFRSVIFGFAHMIVGVPIFAAIIISVQGLFYSYMYFSGGVALSTQAHFQMNLIIIGFLLIYTTIKSFSKSKEIKAQEPSDL